MQKGTVDIICPNLLHLPECELLRSSDDHSVLKGEWPSVDWSCHEKKTPSIPRVLAPNPGPLGYSGILNRGH